MAFVACGTEEIFDPDMNYSLNTDVKTGLPMMGQETATEALEESKENAADGKNSGD